MGVDIGLEVQAQRILAVGRGKAQAFLVQRSDRRLGGGAGGDFLVEVVLALQGVEFGLQTVDLLFDGQRRAVRISVGCGGVLRKGGGEGEAGGKRGEADGGFDQSHGMSSWLWCTSPPVVRSAIFCFL